VVTGGTGFIGSHTVEHLLNLGFRVRCQVRKGRKNPGWLEGLPVEIFECDLLTAGSFATLLKEADYVIHVAGITKAKHRQEYFSGNVTTTKNLLEAVLQGNAIKKFCLVSSLSAAGSSTDGTPLNENSPLHPLTAYGFSKREAEEVTLSFKDRLPVVIVRPPAVYGPRDKDILEMFRAARLGFKPLIGPKNKTLSIIHVKDLAKAIVDATLSDKTTGEVYFATDERVYCYDELYKELAGIVGKNAIGIPIPKALLLGLAVATEAVSILGPRPAVLSIDKVLDLLQTHWVCSGTKLKSDVGFETSITIHEGFRSTYEWYEKRGWLSFKTVLGKHS